MFKHILMAAGLTASMGLSVVGCSKSDSGPAARNYQGAGSKWLIQLTDSTFTMTKYPTIDSTTADLTLSGSVARSTDNDFLTLTVTSSSDTAEVPVDTVVNALEVPNTGVFIKTPDNPAPLVAVISGSCPTGEINSNWVVTKPQIDQMTGEFQETTLTDDGAGTVVYNPTADEFQVHVSGIDNREFDMGDAPVFDLSGQDCSNGVLAAEIDPGSGPENFDMYFTASGFQIVKFPEAMGDQVIFGLPRQSSAVTASTVEGTYSALLYQGGAAADLSTATLTPVRVTVAADGTMQVREITNVANDTMAGSDALTTTSFSTTFTTTAGSHDWDGMFHSDISGAGKMSCSYATVSSTKILACYGFTGTSPNREPLTIIGHSR